MSGAFNLVPYVTEALQKSNPNHEPAGSSAGGQFASGKGTGGKTAGVPDKATAKKKVSALLKKVGAQDVIHTGPRRALSSQKKREILMGTAQITGDRRPRVETTYPGTQRYKFKVKDGTIMLSFYSSGAVSVG